jgi:glutamyl-tRNA reductase
MDRVRLVGLNHTTAALEVRERLALDTDRHRQIIETVKTTFNCEAVALSTCNRVELYIAHPDSPPDVQDLTRVLSIFHAIDPQSFAPHLYERNGRSAIAHLFNVAASLDSMVLGETQILGQVRQAYDASRQLGAAGPVLHPLFQRALSVGKEVQTHTNLSEGRLSIASVAVDYARGIFDHFHDKTILCIGAGKMTSRVLQHFAPLKPGRLIICNRDPDKAAVLADRFASQLAAESAPIDHLDNELARADIIVSSTGAAHPIIHRDQFARLLRRRRYRPAFLIDLAVPRDIEPAVGELENVYLYNLDDLQRVVAQTRGQRNQSFDAAQAIVNRHVDEFEAWLQRRDLGPAIEQLYTRYHAMATEELNRAIAKMPRLSDAERVHLREMTRRIVNKFLHDPVDALNHTDSAHGSPSQYRHAIEKLFKLEEDRAPDQDSEKR